MLLYKELLSVPPSGLRQHHPWTRRHHGPLRLPIFDGHLRSCLHHQLHQVQGRVRAPNFKEIKKKTFQTSFGLVFTPSGWSSVFLLSCFSCRGPNPSKVLQQLLKLQPEQQLSIFHSLHAHLRDRGMLAPEAWQERLQGWGAEEMPAGPDSPCTLVASSTASSILLSHSAAPALWVETVCFPLRRRVKRSLS